MSYNNNTIRRIGGQRPSGTGRPVQVFERGALITQQSYTEVEYMACLLVCGSPMVDGRLRNHQEYWDSVDEWFRANYPTRWLNLINMPEPYTHGQMRFKATFYDWYVEEQNKRLRGEPGYEPRETTLRLGK